MDTTLPITTFAQAEDRLAECLPGYESRPQQQALASAVEATFADGTHLLGQAGCGTGKSLGTLIPAILSGRRTLYSTATKALQDQIAYKDLPFLAENLGVDFTFALLKGRSNYLCMAAYADPDTVNTVNDPAVMSEVAVCIGKGEAFDGERDNIGVEMSDKQWRALTMTSDECPGKSVCPYGKEGSCYAEQAKARAREASVVVVNHALLCMDAFVKEATEGFGTMVGSYDALVVDEAHELRDYATNTLTSRFSEASFRSYVAEVRNFVRAARDDAQEALVNDFGSDLLAVVKVLWDLLKEGRLRAAHFEESADEWIAVADAIRDYVNIVKAINLDKATTDPQEYQKLNTRKSRLVNRGVNLSGRFVDLLVAPLDGLVRWVEVESYTARSGAQTESKVIKSAPVNVGSILNRWFWSRHEVPHTWTKDDGEIVTEYEDPLIGVLVSATMKTKEGPDAFHFIADVLGVADRRELDAGTPFDYKTQSMLYIPRELPDPSKERNEWENMSVRSIYDLVRASRGRALVLFTSKKQMKAAQDFVAPRVPYTCLMQGQRPNKALAAEFTADESSVLFATKSFFTGVDFQGETCSLVIIDKLPFPVPTEPMFQARSENIVAQGKSDFAELTMPEMTLPLQQGFGRLIRHRDDRGVIAILDPRLLTKGYGKQIIKALPDAKLVETIEEVEQFFAVEEAMA